MTATTTVKTTATIETTASNSINNFKTSAKQKTQRLAQSAVAGKASSRSTHETSFFLEPTSSPSSSCKADSATNNRGRTRGDRQAATDEQQQQQQQQHPKNKVNNTSATAFKHKNSLASSTPPSTVFHPSKLTFRFLETDFVARSEQRRLSMGALRMTASSDRLSSERQPSLVHSTVVELVDFIDLFKAFVLRSRKDLANLFERFAVAESKTSVTSLQDDTPASSFPLHSCKSTLNYLKHKTSIQCRTVIFPCSYGSYNFLLVLL